MTIQIKGINTAGQALHPAPAAPSAAEPRGIKPFGSSLVRSCPCKHGRDLTPFVNKAREQPSCFFHRQTLYYKSRRPI